MRENGCELLRRFYEMCGRWKTTLLPFRVVFSDEHAAVPDREDADAIFADLVDDAIGAAEQLVEMFCCCIIRIGEALWRDMASD